VYRPIFVSEGNAAVRENSLLLERWIGSTRAFLEISRGVADGTVATLPPFEAPVLVLSDRRLEYTTGRVGVLSAPTGTQLYAEYRSILDGQAAALPPQESLEVRLSQDLLWLQVPGTSWRFLLAARATSGTAANDRDGDPSTEAWTALASLNRQFSAGVSVAF
jgi:hypothetical protein